MDVQLTASATGKVAVVTPEGELDMASAHLLRRALNAALASGAGLVVVDLCRTAFLDSTALGVLVGAWKRGHASGVAVVASGATGVVARALAITQLDELLQLREEPSPELEHAFREH